MMTVEQSTWYQGSDRDSVASFCAPARYWHNRLLLWRKAELQGEYVSFYNARRK